jgi:hypothetical protein
MTRKEARKKFNLVSVISYIDEEFYDVFHANTC